MAGFRQNLARSREGWRLTSLLAYKVGGDHCLLRRLPDAFQRSALPVSAPLCLNSDVSDISFAPKKPMRPEKADAGSDDLVGEVACQHLDGAYLVPLGYEETASKADPFWLPAHERVTILPSLREFWRAHKPH